MKKQFLIINENNNSETETAPSGKSFLNKPFFHMPLLFIIGFIAYSNTFSVPFHFDDILNIADNPSLRDLGNFWPPSGIRWFGFFTFAVNYHLDGLYVTGYHIVNLSIHILNAIIVYWLMLLTFKTPYFQQSSVYGLPAGRQGSRFTASIALFSALLFISHPVQTQAVTYIVQRFTSLATFFYLLSLFMYIKWRLIGYRSEVIGHGSEPITYYLSPITYYLSPITYYLFSVIFAILAMKTKEIAFTLPFIILLYEFSFLSESSKSDLKNFNIKRVLYLLPFFLTLLIIPISLIGTDRFLEDTLRGLKESTTATNEISRSDYFFTQMRVIITYIRLLFFPVNQSIDYGYPVYHSFFNTDVLLSFSALVFLLGLGIYLFYRSRINTLILPLEKGPACPACLPVGKVGRGKGEFAVHYSLFTIHCLRLASFGIFWFFITLSVESSIIPISDVIFEHRLYLPGIGILIAVPAVIFIVSERFGTGFRQKWKILLSASALIIAAMTVATYSRNAVWLEEITLWEDVIRKNPENIRGYNMVGIIHKNNGDFDEAISSYNMALKFKPDDAGTHVNLGNAYISKGMFNEALGEFLAAVSLQGMDTIDTTALYINIGTLYIHKRLYDKAIEYYTYALNISPDNALVHFNLGAAYKSRGENDRAVEYFRKAHVLNPDKY